jgi:two-component system phosphoglycerate transport system response regulator PgtA
MNIMLVDDDRECLESMTSALQLAGFQVREFDSPVQALRQYSPQTTDVVITDYCLPGMSGIDLLEKIHRIDEGAPVIVISGASKKDTRSRSLRAGACAFFPKPLNFHRIISKIKQFSTPKGNS